MTVGMRVDLPPLPPVKENTEIVDAGALSFGVEFRVLNDDIVRENYGQERIDLIRTEAEFEMYRNVDDSGVSIHVFGEDGLEYLRFDCFQDEPHYHYVLPHLPYQQIVPFDTIANGDALTWAMSCLRSRLEPMLRASGCETSAERIRASVVRDALDRVETKARAITRQKASAAE
jgi:hypothetical protein